MSRLRRLTVDPQDRRAEEFVEQARRALRCQRRMDARRWLWAALSAAPSHDAAWLMLAAFASPRAGLYYAGRALQARPHNPVARAAEAWARQRLDDSLARTAQHAVPRPVTPPPPARLAPSPAVRPRRVGGNWALSVGLLLILFVSGLAILGPRLAPRDPLKENFIVKAGGEFVKPPFPPFAVPGFPLGSDEFGRDILSQLLWAVRPTLTLVLVAAALRLVAGTTVGLVAGWASGRASRLWNAAISGALAAPVLFVALCVIAALGQRWGVWAFIVGLSLTGWAEAARLVREQTRLVKAQPFIESARALGASGPEIIGRHVLPQILPLAWMLLAFEISGALLTTAGLGFLGYFVYSIWVPIGDFVGLRTTGRPELGQMLGSATRVQAQPWGMLAAGGVVFLAVLGFNLLGEGLQSAFTLESARRRRQGRAGQALEAAAGWAGDRLFDPLSPWRRGLQTAVAVAALALILGGGGYALWRTQAAPRPVAAIAVPGGHAWASSQHDAQGTFWSDVAGPKSPQVIFKFHDEGGLAGGPALAADGTLYLASHAAGLSALAPDGTVLWQTALPEAPAGGGPALGPAGEVYVTDQAGGLAAVRPDGSLNWHLPGGPRGAPLSGPIVSPDGTVYYATEVSLLAVEPGGAILWETALPTFSYASPVPRLSADARFVFFEDVVVDARTGSALYAESPQPLDKYTVGADGRIYLLTQTDLMEFRPSDGEAQLVERIHWDTNSLGLGFRYPQEGGVTPGGRTWLYFSSEYDFGKVAWLDVAGQPLTPLDYPYRGAVRLLGIDQTDTTYVCGALVQLKPAAECRANRPGETAPLWKVRLEEGRTPVGGALASGRLYVALAEGWLIALGD